MDKKEFIIGQIAKTNKKNYENFVITRIINLIDDFDLKFITQQPVALNNGKRALTDLYFPQIDFHVEIDEAHHKKQIESDVSREADIVDITGHTIKRVDVDGNIGFINQQIDQVVKDIKIAIGLKKEKNGFTPWDIEAEFKSETYINKGYIDLEDRVAFRLIADACNCFGHNYEGYQNEPNCFL